MNNKIFIFVLLLFWMLFSANAYSFNSCNDKQADKTCVQISVTNQAKKVLENLVVYLEPMDGQVLAPATEAVVIGQLGKSFTPYISVSQVNSKVEFANQDDITHHIYSAGSDNKFSFKIRAGQTNSTIQFNQTSEVAMGCNIHDWMSGYLLLVNTPYFGKTNSRGQVSFDIDKQGKYKIVVWHPQMQSENNRMIKEVVISTDLAFAITLENEISEVPRQENDDDFDFLSDYE